MKKKPAKDIFSIFSVNIIILIFNFATSIIIARLLGPKGKGEIVTILLWPTLLVWLGNMGIGNANVVYTAKFRNKSGTIFANSVVFAFIFGSIIMVLAHFFVPMLINFKTHKILFLLHFALFFIPINMLSDYGFAIIQGFEKFKLYNIFRIFQKLGYAMLIFLFAGISKISVQIVVYSSIGMTLLNTIIFLSFLYKHTEPPKIIEKDLMKQSLKFGVKSHIGTIFNYVNLRLDQLILIGKLNPAMVGLYSVAVNLSELLWQISTPISSVISPITAKSKKTAAKKTVSEMCFLYFFLFLIVGIPLMAFAKSFIPFLYGASFKPSVLPFRILIIASLGYGMGNIIKNGLIGLGYPEYASLSGFISACINIVSLLYLIPKFQILGAAWATLIGYWVYFFSVTFYINKMLNFSFSEIYSGIFVFKDLIKMLKGREL